MKLNRKTIAKILLTSRPCANDYNVTETEFRPNNSIPNIIENNVEENKQSSVVTDLRRSLRIRREPTKLDL